MKSVFGGSEKAALMGNSCTYIIVQFKHIYLMFFQVLKYLSWEHNSHLYMIGIIIYSIILRYPWNICQMGILVAKVHTCKNIWMLYKVIIWVVFFFALWRLFLAHFICALYGILCQFLGAPVFSCQECRQCPRVATDEKGSIFIVYIAYEYVPQNQEHY